MNEIFLNEPAPVETQLVPSSIHSTVRKLQNAISETLDVNAQMIVRSGLVKLRRGTR